MQERTRDSAEDRDRLRHPISETDDKVPANEMVSFGEPPRGGSASPSQVSRFRQQFIDQAATHSPETLIPLALTCAGRWVPSPWGLFIFTDRWGKSVPWIRLSTEEPARAPTFDPMITADLIEHATIRRCVSERGPIILNEPVNYGRGEESPGHFRRVLLVPIIRQNRVMAIMGLANKTEAFEEQDAEKLLLFADCVWETLQHTDLRNAYRALNSEYQHLFHEMLEGFCKVEIEYGEGGQPLDFRFLAVNPAFERMTGLTRNQVLDQCATAVLPTIAPRWLERFARVAATGEPERFEDEAPSLGLHVDVMIVPSGRTQCTCLFRDISFSEWALTKLSETRGLLEAAIAQSPSGILIADAPDVRIRLANPAAFHIRGGDPRLLTGIEVEQHGKAWQTFFPDGSPYPPEQLPLSRAVLNGQVTQNEEVIIRDEDGMDHWVSANASPIRNAGGDVVAGIVIFHDITVHKVAEAQLSRLNADLQSMNIELRESEARFRAIMESTSDCVFLKDHQRRYVMVNPAMERLFHISSQSLVGKCDEELFSEKETEKSRHADLRVLAGETVETEDTRLFDGQVRTFHVKKTPVRDHTHAVVGVCGIAREITERKAAEKRQARLQAQLSQAQKLESVGRLAGGVAHDFNNMVGVILSRLDLALEQAPPGHGLVNHLKEIQNAAQRSAELTRQLLAFARCQEANPKPIHLNDKVAGMLTMLGRLLGEDVGVVWRPSSTSWPVNMDPSQLDQIITNLCVNARDAIDGVGHIIIETQNIHANTISTLALAHFPHQDHVKLSIRDNGRGMDPETVQHIFEPFFTTKDPSQGTGLGLATVYGIVQQNHGHISVSSEVGKGTCFEILLPRTSLPVISNAVPDKPIAPPARGETLLFVEDDKIMLETIQAILRSLGYRVLAADKPSAAMEHATGYRGIIHLLLTDVVMPEMNGRELSIKLLAERPGMKCLFMSGYTADVISNRGKLDPGANFIQKPFNKAQLALKLRQILDESPSPGIHHPDKP